jgi:hypothetical protein
MVLSDSAEVMETVAKERFLRKSPFLEFCDAEGLPVITGYGVEDLRTVPLWHWERLGGPAAYCHLEGSQGFVGSMVAEIPPEKFKAYASSLRGADPDTRGPRSDAVLV